MANYKNIVDVETVAEATESMNVLVEDAGSLKKVPAGGMIGGGNGKTLIIMRKEQNAPMGFDDLPYNEYSANMTFAETVEAMNNGELCDVVLWLYVENNHFARLYLDQIYLDNYPGSIRIYMNYQSGSSNCCLDFNSNNTITSVAMES